MFFFIYYKKKMSFFAYHINGKWACFYEKKACCHVRPSSWQENKPFMKKQA
jgi:hypothetical protein